MKPIIAVDHQAVSIPYEFFDKMINAMNRPQPKCWYCKCIYSHPPNCKVLSGDTSRFL